VLIITDKFADHTTEEYRDKLYKEQHFVDGTFKVISYGTKFSAYINRRTYEDLFEYCKANDKVVIGEIVNEAIIEYLEKMKKISAINLKRDKRRKSNHFILKR
jgi:hypothetical protein